MGEIAALRADGTESALLRLVTSANVACGAHAGDEAHIEATIREAHALGVRVGAHPGYPDRVNFGRVALALTAEEITASVLQQLRWFQSIAARHAVPVAYVKPHGALYNVAAKDARVAAAIAQAVVSWRPGAAVMGLAGSLMLDVFRQAGLTPVAEGFADRAYEPDGTLRSRQLPGALLRQPAEAAAQALALAQRGDIDSICLHSDTPGSVALVEAVADSLRRADLLRQKNFL
jgi:UPF0271 protein